MDLFTRSLKHDISRQRRAGEHGSAAGVEA